MQPAAAAAHAGERTAPPAEATHAHSIRVERFRNASFHGDNASIGGPVRITARDDVTGDVTTITGADIDYANGVVTTNRSFALSRADAVIQGSGATYSLRDDTGSVRDVHVVASVFRMTGRQLDLRADGAYVLHNGDFTTCRHGRPDYHVRANRIEVAKDLTVSTRGATLYAGTTPLLTVPSWKRNLRRSSKASLPLPAFNSQDGLFIGLSGAPLQEQHRSLTYDARIGTRRTPGGYLAWQQDLQSSPDAEYQPDLLATAANPIAGYLERQAAPLFGPLSENRDPGPGRIMLLADIANRQSIYTRRRTDITVSRLPEVGLQAFDVLGRRSGSGSGHGIRLDVGASVGYVEEQPTRTEGGRISLHADIAPPRVSLGCRVTLQAALSGWLNGYSTGTLYALATPEMEATYAPSARTALSVGYRYLADRGSSPFVSDRRDLRQELRLRWQQAGAWSFGVLTLVDLQRSRAYDTQLALVRNFDCMQIGLSWRERNQSFGIIFNLLGVRPTPRH